MIINSIAVDDEPLALDLTVTYINQTPFLNLVGSFTSAIDALTFLHENAVDLIFLDISMPGLNGMELARIINTNKQERPRKIIFTTAFNQYALEGYQVSALDYLLKPYNYVDFLNAANKALQFYELIAKEAPVNSELPVSASAQDEYLYVKVEYQYIKLFLKDILYVESLGDYIKFHLVNTAKPVMSLMTLKSLEEKIPASQFMRIHRSFIIALDKIDAVTKNSVQIGKMIINVTDQYKESFNQYLKKWI
ncbi:MAG: ypdB 2 [Sphingobacteriales bacterium]|nr:ypdB 2 [Sphingobacteriales bacterium]